MNTAQHTIATWLGTGSINIFGCPFAGKDTQGKVLADMFDAPLIGGGDILRSHHDPERITQMLDSGGLIPSDFYFDLVLPYLSNPKYKGKPLILDSVGRSHGEEPTIIKAAEHAGHPLKAVVLLQLKEDDVWRRFEAAKVEHDRDGRADDKREVLKNRLQKFNDRTLPVIEFYRDMGVLVEVDGGKTRQQVTQEIIDALYQRATR